jgi:membrane protein DedA with SNARE-associated domain
MSDIGRIGTWLVEAIDGLGYLGILVLMAMESSVLPVPSELVMPPAGYLAYRGEMNIWLALAAGVIGSLIGAYANYWVASHLGRWVFVRYGRWVLLTERSLERTERFFKSHGEIATFVGRLFPVIRHLISIPAGLARMRLAPFFAYTGAGAGIWCAILLGLGWLIGSAGESLTREMLMETAERYTHRAVVVMVPIAALLVAVYVIRHRRRPRAATPEAGKGGAGQGAGGSGD